MTPDTVPSAIVAQLVEAGQELERWAETHRTATFAEHEQGVLAIFRRVMGPTLGAVLARALGLDHPSAQQQRATCPECGQGRRPHMWRVRHPVGVCGRTPLQRPYYWCTACQRGWSPADAVLDLAPYQVLSQGVAAWLAELGAEMPFARAAVRLEALTGVGLGTETVRTHAQVVGTALVEAETAAAEHVLATQAAAEPVEVGAELLVVETDGVNVRFTDGWHEVKVGEVAGCERGNGLHPHDPAYRPAELIRPRYLAARLGAAAFGPRLLAEAARQGALDVVGWEQPPSTDPRLLGPSGPALAILRPLVVLGDGARWIWELAAEHFGPARTEVVDYWHATQHLWTLGRALHGETEPYTRTWVKRAEAMLWGRGAERLLPHLARTRAPCAAAAEVLRIERGYFTTNCARMDYPSFRAQGLPIGSGAVESAAKHVVQLRMKRPGMRWSPHGGQAMLALCARVASRRPLPACALVATPQRRAA